MPFALLSLLQTVVLASPILAQPSSAGVDEVRVARVRAIAPEGTTRGDVLRRVVQVTLDQKPWPGLPQDILERELITVSLALSVPDGIDGWSAGDAGLVVLRLADVSSWSHARLTRVLRHELSHIALARYLGATRITTWFNEGFAEWAAGGVTCTGEARMRLALQFRGEDAKPLSITTVDPGLPRLNYDLYTSFFEFLSTADGDAMRDGALMRKVKEEGVEVGTMKIFGDDIATLEQRWRAYLQERYAGSLTELPNCAEY